MALIASILSKFDDSGVKKAKHSFGGLKTALGALGIGIGIKQIADTLIDAAKAAEKDKKSMELLNAQLTKNAHATKAQVKQNNAFIDSLSNQVGVVDDDLRPVMGKFVRVTGSVQQSQKLLKVALDASAYAGQPLEKVSTALSKAFAGNTTSLKRMFPELAKSKDMIGDLAKASEGYAAQQADPFAKFNVAMDNLKEKLGYVILPYVEQFIDLLTKPGGAIDQLGAFLDDIGNPKTDVGKTFQDIKKAVEETIKGVSDFFALFGGGDAMKGFGNIAAGLVKMLPALLALKGILMLAKAGKSLQQLALAINMLKGGSALSGVGGAAGATLSVGTLAISAVALSQLAALLATEAAQGTINEPLAKKGMKATLATGTFGARGEAMVIPVNTKDAFAGFKGLFSEPLTQPTTNVTINVTNQDPKATVDALTKYLKTNGQGYGR